MTRKAFTKSQIIRARNLRTAVIRAAKADGDNETQVIVRDILRMMQSAPTVDRAEEILKGLDHLESAIGDDSRVASVVAGYWVSLGWFSDRAWAIIDEQSE